MNWGRVTDWKTSGVRFKSPFPEFTVTSLVHWQVPV